MHVSVPMDRLAQLLDSNVPREFSGTVGDPTDALTEDAIDWKFQRGGIELKPGPGGAILFATQIQGGSAILHGRFGLRRRNGGLLGRIESAFSESFSETVHFAGTVSGSIKPTFGPDWSLNPNLETSVSFSKAEAQLFGKALKLSFRGKAAEKVNDDLRKKVAEFNEQLKRDKQLRNAAVAAWADLRAPRSISDDPPAFLRLQPVSIAISEPTMVDGNVGLNLKFSTLAEIRLAESPPESETIEFPPLQYAISEPGSFQLAVPINVKLKDMKPQYPNGSSAFNFDSDYGSVKVSKVTLGSSGENLVIRAAIVADPKGLNRNVAANIMVFGKPELSTDKGQVSLKNLRYSVKTKDALLKMSNKLAGPWLLKELQKKAVFQFAKDKQEVLGKANQQLETALSALPQGVTSDIKIDTLDTERVIVSNGWMILVAEASGPLNVDVDLASAWQ